MTKRVNSEIERFHDYSLFIPTRTIYMGSEYSDVDLGESGVDAKLAERHIKNLLILESMSQEPITIILNNIGGDVAHGMAIYDSIQACKSHVTIQVFGNAMSMGSIILQAADERVMSKNSSQMIHYGQWGIYGHAKTAQKFAEECKRLDKDTELLYLARIKEKHPHYTLQRLQRLLDHDTFLTAAQSVEIGLADRILE